MLSALAYLAVSPHAARLTRTVPVRADRRWHLGAAPPRPTLVDTASVAVVLGILAAAGVL